MRALNIVLSLILVWGAEKAFSSDAQVCLDYLQGQANRGSLLGIRRNPVRAKYILNIKEDLTNNSTNYIGNMNRDTKSFLSKIHSRVFHKSFRLNNENETAYVRYMKSNVPTIIEGLFEDGKVCTYKSNGEVKSVLDKSEFRKKILSELVYNHGITTSEFLSESPVHNLTRCEQRYLLNDASKKVYKNVILRIDQPSRLFAQRNFDRLVDGILMDEFDQQIEKNDNYKPVLSWFGSLESMITNTASENKKEAFINEGTAEFVAQKAEVKNFIIQVLKNGFAADGRYCGSAGHYTVNQIIGSIIGAANKFEGWQTKTDSTTSDGDNDIQEEEKEEDEDIEITPEDDAINGDEDEQQEDEQQNTDNDIYHEDENINACVIKLATSPYCVSIHKAREKCIQLESQSTRINLAIFRVEKCLNAQLEIKDLETAHNNCINISTVSEVEEENLSLCEAQSPNTTTNAGADVEIEGESSLEQRCQLEEFADTDECLTLNL